MKKRILQFSVKLVSLVLIPPFFTLAVTGSHKKEVLQNENPSYVHMITANTEESVTADEYVLGVTAGFLSDWNIDDPGISEMAKMYAVLINTYMALKSESTLVMEADNFDLNYLNPQMRRLLWGNDTYAQKETMLSAWLSEVYGLVIKSNGEIITPYFHKLSAGATRTGPFSYLICADTSRDLENSDFLSVTELTYSQFCETILQKYPDCGISEEHPQDFIQIISRDDAGYVTKILIGSITISGEEFADLFDLSSPSFTITYPQNALKIVTKGIGHGYGISLNYASYLAANQNTYDTIISYFYDNIEITNE